MAQKISADNSYDKFIASYKAGLIGNFYILHGEERYLLDHSLSGLRKRLCPEGLDGFNYKRYEGKYVRIDELDDAINTLPVFSDRTLIEIHDLALFPRRKKTETEQSGQETEPGFSEDDEETAYESGPESSAESQRLLGILSNLPDYVCVLVIFDTIPYKPDSRLKHDKEILKYAQVVNFALQDQAKLLNWINRRFEASGKRISRSDAQYLTMITDGHMTALAGEIEKVSAFSYGDTVTRYDIDAVVTPVPGAVAYKLSDALLNGKHAEAMRILDELFLMREPPQRIIYNISMKMRHFLAARICIENKLSKNSLIEWCGLKYDFMASILLDAARKATIQKCRSAVLLCAEAAYDINSTSEPEARLIELVTQLAHASQRN